MNTNYISAAWASVLFCLALKEFVHALSLNHFEVFYHTHAIAFAVAFVKVCKFFTGHRVAFAAGLDLVFGKFFAASFDVAVFGSGKAACAICYFASYSRYPMCISDVGSADGTVHSAGCNKFRGKFVIYH